MKKLLFMLMCFFVLFNVVEAREYTNDVETTVVIDENGNGHVTEVWGRMGGGHMCHKFYNLNGKEITEYEVYGDDKKYDKVADWEGYIKAGGYNHDNSSLYYDLNNDLNLCWDADYRVDKYKITYSIKNLVQDYADKQVLNFEFLNNNANSIPNHYKLIIENKNISSKTEYGYYGFNSFVNIDNGVILFQSKRDLFPEIFSKPNEHAFGDYASIVLGFPKGTFNVQRFNNASYKDVINYEIQMENKYKNQSNNLYFILLIVVFIGCLLISVLPLIIIQIMEYRQKVKYDKTKFIIPKEVPYYRDIPFEKDILLAYFIGVKTQLFKPENLIVAFLLKWVKEKKVKIVNYGSADKNYYVDISGLVNEKDETGLIAILKEASFDLKLTPEKFNVWYSNNTRTIKEWLIEIQDYSRQKLVDSGYIIQQTVATKDLLHLKDTYIYTEKLTDEFIKLKGLKKFIDDMTTISQKEVLDVHLFEDYLIFAQLFGNIDKISNQLNEFYKLGSFAQLDGTFTLDTSSLSGAVNSIITPVIYSFSYVALLAFIVHLIFMIWIG